MTNQALRECLLPKSNEEEESLVKNLSYKKRKNSKISRNSGAQMFSTFVKKPFFCYTVFMDLNIT